MLNATFTPVGGQGIKVIAAGGADSITTGGGNDDLNGGGGADALAGGGGDDRYHVDNVGDSVAEGAAGGFDRVLASADHVLTAGSEVEMITTNDNLATTGIDLTGNALAQYLFGNAGANILDSGGGGDVMLGFGGDDRYIIRDAADRIVEIAGEGNDRLLSAIDYVLTAGQSIEIMTTDDNLGTSGVDLSGNALGQYLFGNAGANVLNGKEGADVMLGLGGADSFAFTRPLDGSFDRIGDFDGDDTILLEDAVFGLAMGSLNPNVFVVGTAAADADDRIIYNQTLGALYYDADGNGAGARNPVRRPRRRAGAHRRRLQRDLKARRRPGDIPRPALRFSKRAARRKAGR